jgi:hypothetical protein
MDYSIIFLPLIFGHFKAVQSMKVFGRNDSMWFKTYTDHFGDLAPDDQYFEFKNWINVSLDFPVEEKSRKVVFVYDEISNPMFPPEFFNKLRGKTISILLVYTRFERIEHEWFKYAENLTNLLIMSARIPKLESGLFVDLKRLSALILQQ